MALILIVKTTTERKKIPKKLHYEIKIKLLQNIFKNTYSMK